MSVLALIFLGAIAFATVLMAAIQVGAIVYAGRLAKRVDRLADQVELEIKPLFATLRTISMDAARATSLAVVQVERAERLMADFSQRAEQTMAVVQQAIVTPARHGLAIVGGLRAALAALRDVRGHASSAGRGRGDDEDALFI